MKINEIFEEKTNSGKLCGKCGNNTIVNTKKSWYCTKCDTKKTNETTTAGAVATSMGGGNGFANGGPGTLSRAGTTTKKKTKRKKHKYSK